MTELILPDRGLKFQTSKKKKMKIEIELIQRALERAELAPEKVKKIIHELSLNSAKLEAPYEAKAKTKKQFVVAINDPFGELKCNALSGWIMQIPQDKAPQDALNILRSAVCDFNLSPKGRRMPITTFREAFKYVSPKCAKEYKLAIKTKEPVLLIPAPRLIESEE